MKSTLSRLFGLSEKENDDIQDSASSNEVIRQIPVSEIVPNQYQPRTFFDDEKIKELALTIRTHGIIQPIVVREIRPKFYEIIAGERRFRAVSSLGWDTIPAIVKAFNDTETASVALIENLQREELSPFEEAVAYQKLIDLHNLTQEALAQRLGKGQSTVANKLRLLKLPGEIQQALLDKSITERHARALIPLKLPQLQITLLHEIIEKQLNVKQTEDRVVMLLTETTEKKPKPKRKFKAISKDIRIAMNTIRESLQMVTKTGMNIDSQEEEHDEYYQITIKIPKK
ncbi:MULTISPECIES: nucleoid occlusion protein [unclassified Bacillus (in: firmicutes)]|uniref:nucleoid occlusion protein n=1 Tax=unclassified Bacillus (in: firmicutes) TaxID=185979 RepID=UPI000BF231AD|nr:MULTISPECIES: nucleoid occlusion protein [unclassified Bacillus (in: firmicutes)]PEJ58680.1 nucleoid occlusion protein [Bacillus sp. AFS002410]PEL09290.1 nucleoid occlusion protein [Bacillus sp. AFS017336]